MNRLFYSLAMRAAAPLGYGYLALSPRRRELLQRFRPAMPAGLGPAPLWIHACSIGEWSAAKPLIEAVQARWPGMPVLATVSTQSAMAMAITSPIPAAWFPFDHPRGVAGFFERADPRALILVETELWPGVLHEAARRGVPAAVVNGRISDKHLPRFAKMGSMGREMFASLRLAAVQGEAYAERFRSLGTPAANVHVTGSIKFDAAPCAPDAVKGAAIRAAAGWPADAPILVFGSTRPGDEALAMAAYRAARTVCPGLRLVVAPRHLDRVPEAAAAIDEPFQRRSEGAGAASAAPILLLDTMGELNAVYGTAALAVVGGSFYPGVEGHNPIEPAALGAPVVFGPRMRNFRDAAEALLARRAAVQCGDSEALPSAVAALLGPEGAEERARLAAAGPETAAAMRGATARTLDLMAPLLRR